MSINAVAPLAGAWIEIDFLSLTGIPLLVAPLAGAWIEILKNTIATLQTSSLPSRERGLKSDVSAMVCR